MNKIFKTREFSFPNNGHSVRKLVSSLRAMGDVTVTLEYRPCMYGGEDFDMWFQVTDRHGLARVKFNTLKLADKLETMGTRFTAVIKFDRVQLSFYTKWNDIACHTEQYGVL